ncbi:MAG: hypothetical protein PHO02_05685 [Candidatus Nanoarchaeia archaeon]|nr:hypothetical protein [Candidatus Nanoarchaeia archaeon]
MIQKAIMLYEKKWHHIYSLFGKKRGKIALQPSLHKLKLYVSAQIRLLKKLEKANAGNTLLIELREVLEQQKKILSEAKITRIISRDYSSTISSMEEGAILLLKKEQELVSRLEKELPNPKQKKAVIRLSRNQAAQAAQIITSVNNSISNLSNAIGNRKEVQKANKLLMKQIARLQHTEVYGFLREDAGKIKKAAKAILENPGETKLKHMLASIYLVAPFTFDATGAVIFLRYAAKYANKKSKALQNRIKAIRNKRKRHLRVFQ